MAVPFKFDANQQFQRDAIDSVVELFAGQEALEQGLTTGDLEAEGMLFSELVFGNSLDLASETIRRNLRRVQDREVEVDGATVPAIAEGQRQDFDADDPLRFTVEMETGTGKTYVYVRTIAELYLRYGFRKFVIVVPSVAIKEGTVNSLGQFREHIRDVYDGLQYDVQVYDGKAPTRVRQFATSSHLQILVVNIAGITGDKATRIFHRPSDDLSGYAPVDFIRACRPVLILDEPQSLKGEAQSAGIEELNPLFRVGYSATPPPGSHVTYRLTPVDAYNQKLVKRIGVLSITKDADLNEAYVEVTKVTAKTTDVTATAVIYKATRQGTKATKVTLHKDDDLFELSGEREVYRGWVVEDIHADVGLVEFANHEKVAVNATTSEADDQHLRLMVRSAIEAHFDKELLLHRYRQRDLIPAGIKPLTLFFIERVAHYAPADAKLRVWFEEEYEAVRANGKYQILDMPEVADAHNGYFAQTNKGVAKDARSDSAEAAAAYELIMKKKQELLSFDVALRFIFSHSALAEGWDNPNVFTICHLQDGKSTMRKRQQVGRGLRLPVMENGDRCHVDEVNLLTVIAKGAFAAFASELQKEIEQETGASFTGKIIDLTQKKPLALKENALTTPEFVSLWEKISPRTDYRLQFDTDDVVTAAIARINKMDAIEPVMFRKSKHVVKMDTEGLGGTDGIDLGEVVAASARRMPDVVGDLCRRLPLSRATIVRILKESDRLDDVKINPAVFIDQVTDAISRAVYEKVADGITYTPNSSSWPAAWIKEKHQSETVSPRVVAVANSVTDHVVCDSEVEETFAKFLDARSDVPIFLKLPEWFKIPTPLGNYNPDWAFVREHDGGSTLHLVRETKGSADITKLQWESEGWKIKFGQAHFDALGVDFAFGHDPEVLIEAPGAQPES
jgi:type III restriction enzyme